MNSWLEIKEDSDFSIYNIPFGIFSAEGKGKRIGVAIGDQVMDLSEINRAGIFDVQIATEVFENEFLNDFIALGKEVTNGVREKIQSELCDAASKLKELGGVFYKQSEVVMHLPIRVGDYTDFYSSIEHATNLGKLFRDPENALLPNWRHLPVGYHGRASSIILSGQSIHRPKDKPNQLMEIQFMDHVDCWISNWKWRLLLEKKAN